MFIADYRLINKLINQYTFQHPRFLSSKLFKQNDFQQKITFCLYYNLPIKYKLKIFNKELKNTIKSLLN